MNPFEIGILMITVGIFGLPIIFLLSEILSELQKLNKDK